jgi:hypothetical protein
MNTCIKIIKTVTSIWFLVAVLLIVAFVHVFLSTYNSQVEKARQLKAAREQGKTAPAAPGGLK